MERLSGIGTRAIMRDGNVYRVVCATCEGGGTVAYRTREAANAAAARDSGKPCRAGTYRWGRGCGAS